MRLFNDLASDFRSSFRTFRRYPGLTAVALLSLALGIGANTLAFSFVNALLYRSLPYPEANRLVMIDNSITPAECLDVLEHSQDVFEGAGCYGDGTSSASVADDDPGTQLPEHLMGQRFTAGMGPTLGIRPMIGRWFSAEEEASASPRVAVISHRLWQRRFSRTTDVLNKRLRIDGQVVSIIGVMPDEFEFMTSSADYWLPFHAQELEGQNNAEILGAVARLRPSATLAQAQAVILTLVTQRDDKRPLRLTTLERFVQSQLLDSAMILQGTVVFVLLIACANVAGLLLTQAVSQQRELAVRTALGSSAWRIVRKVLVHSVVLFCAGGLLGLLVGQQGIEWVQNAMAFAANAYGEPRGGYPRGLNDVSIDGSVLLFTFAISVVCGLLAAIAPALQTSRTQPLDVLRDSSSSVTSGIARQRLRSVFVSVQIALAFVLLIGAALMLNGLTRTLNQEIGFDPRGLVTIRVPLPEDSDSRTRFNVEQMRQNLLSTSGVMSATAIGINPPLSGAVNMPVQVDGRTSPSDQRSQFLPILPDYFKTLRVTVVQGREFGLQDGNGNLPVAVINETAARLYWGNESPIGKYIQLQSPQLPDEPVRQVVGVVTEVSQYSFQQNRPQLYVPFAQMGVINNDGLKRQVRNLTFVVRTARPAPELVLDAANAIRRADSSQAVASVRTMQQTAFASSERRGVFVVLIGLFGGIAVMLAVIGVYGVMANVVSQRTSELGIRIALGANRKQIRWLVLRRGGLLVGIGLAVGVVLSLAVTRVIRSMLLGASPTDPFTFLAGIILLGGVGLLACYLPARRASRIDPIVALRQR